MPHLPTLTPVATQPLSVVLLAREDRATIESALATWRTWLEQRGTPFEIILVYHGGDLATQQHLATLSAPQFTLLTHDSPREEGAALRLGLAAAGHPLIFYTRCRPDY